MNCSLLIVKCEGFFVYVELMLIIIMCFFLWSSEGLLIIIMCFFFFFYGARWAASVILRKRCWGIMG